MTTVQAVVGTWIRSADGILMPLYMKDPQDVLDYGFDWGDQLAADDTIVAATFSTGSSALNVLSSNFDDTNTYVWLQGGVPSVTYSVVIHVTTEKGRQHDRTFAVQCGQN